MKTCCYCFSVRTGAIIIGTLSMVSSIISLIWFISKITSSQRPQQSIPEHQDEMLLYSWIFSVSVCIGIFVTIFSSISMIYGVLQRSSRHMYPWLALTFAGMVMEACVSLSVIIVVVSMVPHVLMLLVVFIIALQIGMASYFWLVVRQHYDILRADKYHVAFPNSTTNMDGLQISPHPNV